MFVIWLDTPNGEVTVYGFADHVPQVGYARRFYRSTRRFFKSVCIGSTSGYGVGGVNGVHRQYIHCGYAEGRNHFFASLSSEHPDTCMADDKEPHYFSVDLLQEGVQFTAIQNTRATQLQSCTTRCLKTVAQRRWRIISLLSILQSGCERDT